MNKIQHSLFKLLSVTDIIVLLSVAGLYCILTFSHITNSSIWYDESFTAYLVHHNIFQIIRYTATDVQPPLYYFVLKLWSTIFGFSDLALRSLSVIFGLVTLAASFVLVRRFFSRTSAYISIFLLSISPMFVRYGIEARMYTMVAAISVIATYYFLKAQASDDKKDWRRYGIFVALGMWTHYLMVLVWIAHLVWRVAVLRPADGQVRKWSLRVFSRPIRKAYLLAFFIYVAWLPLMIIQTGAVQLLGYWVQPSGINGLTNYITNALLYQQYYEAPAIAGTIIIVLAAGVIYLARQRMKQIEPIKRDAYSLFLTISIIPVLVLLVLSCPPFRPVFVERYLLASTVFLSLFIGITIQFTKVKMHNFANGIVFGLVIFSSIWGISNVYSYGNFNKNVNEANNTKQVITTLIKDAQPGEPIITDSPMAYYNAVHYQTNSHQVYFINSETSYAKLGATDMMRDSSYHKILNMTVFTKAHPKFWFFDVNQTALQIDAQKNGWSYSSTIAPVSPITNNVTETAGFVSL